ncbi:MAG TPA: ABC transporter permease [Brevefilum sp.]|nr:ABC transporter permease [Brevefilum sp.]HOR19524.1 ABC transporter permease [Brevefilum sp.]HPL68762.1 ABC transporter permease [Brevefilum sp.]
MGLRKLFLIAFKDLRLIFRDPAALIMMLLAPFLLTIGMGALTGGFSGGGGSTFSDIPVEIVNLDEGILGQTLVDVFTSPELEALVSPRLSTDLGAAQALVDSNQSAAVVCIPAGFSESLLSPRTQGSSAAPIEFYANPTMPNSAGFLRSLVDQFVNQVEIGRVSGEVIVTQLLENGLISYQQAPDIGAQIGYEMGQASATSSSIRIKADLAEGEALEFNILAYMAPSMALMFLMFTVTYGARSLLVEDRAGTLPRMLVAPTSSASVLGGKFAGIFLTAIAQLTILIGGTSLMFSLQWGDTMGVILLILAAAFGATGWGVLFAAILKTPGQIAVTGSAVMLLFGLLGGSFFDLSMLPGWVQMLNKITPNFWGNDGFFILGIGGQVKDISTHLTALLIMGGVLFAFASIWIGKRGLARK